MDRFVVGLVALWLLVGGAQAELRVVASFYPLYVAAMNVAEGVPGTQVDLLADEPQGCLHDYHASPADLRKLSRADVLLVNGVGLETFLPKMASQLPHLRVVTATGNFPLVDGNPHVWVSIEGAISQVARVAEGLAAADPGNREAYRRNAEAYTERLRTLQGEMQATLAPCRGARIVTFHEAFAYFARDFGLEVAGVVEREPGSEPMAREMAGTIDMIRREQVRAVFTEPQYPRGSAEAIAKETGVGLYDLDPVVTGPMGPAARGAYLEAMRRNGEVLLRALSPQAAAGVKS